MDKQEFTEQELAAIVKVYDLLIGLARQKGQGTMETVTLRIGSVQSSSSGTATLDTTQDVEFEGELLAEYSEPGTGRDGGPTDTRGTTTKLYRASDGRLIVHVKDWSHWQGEPTTYTLHQVTEGDLTGRGQFAALGREAGYGRPLSLDEALQRGEYAEPEPAGQILREATLCQCCGEFVATVCWDCATEAERCADCGQILPPDATPYRRGEDEIEVYLCETCAEPGA